MPGVAVLEWKAPACHSELELASEAQYKQDGDVSVTI